MDISLWATIVAVSNITVFIFAYFKGMQDSFHECMKLVEKSHMYAMKEISELYKNAPVQPEAKRD